MPKRKKITRADKIEFVAYLRTLTPSQRQGVLDKERKADRVEFVRICRETIALLD